MPGMRKPRAFLVSVLTSILLAIEYVAADAAAWQLERHPVDGAPALANLLVLTRFRPFYVGAFASGDSVGDRLLAFGAGVAVAMVVFWFVVWTKRPPVEDEPYPPLETDRDLDTNPTYGS